MLSGFWWKRATKMHPEADSNRSYTLHYSYWISSLANRSTVLLIWIRVIKFLYYFLYILIDIEWVPHAEASSLYIRYSFLLIFILLLSSNISYIKLIHIVLLHHKLIFMMPIFIILEVTLHSYETLKYCAHCMFHMYFMIGLWIFTLFF